MAKPVFTIPLMPLEKILLSQVARIAGLDTTANPVSDTDTVVFRAWNWTSLAYESLKEDLNIDQLAETYNGNHDLAYRDCLHFLAHQGLLASSQFRSDAIRAANPSFPGVFTEHTIDSIETGIHPDDRESWIIVSWMFQGGHLYWDPLSFTHQERTYDIFKSVYTFQHRMARPENFQEIENYVVTHNKLLEQWTVGPIPMIDDADDDGDFNERLPPQSISKGFSLHPRHRVVEGWPLGKTYTDENGDYTDEWLRYALRTASSEQPIGGVLENVCMLPFADLHSISPERMEQTVINYSMPFMERENFSRLRWVVWRPVSHTAMGAHLLYTEDEVYQYCLLNNWYFPDHFCDEEVVFGMRPVDDTDFFIKISEFWSSWNDCSLSWDAKNKQLYLLETIPGLRFRCRQKFQDRHVAQRYFRNLVEDHAAGRLQDSTMQDLLGAEHYNKIFAHSLRYIPSDQITIYPGSIVGEGRNGKVYRAKWTRSDGVLATSLRGETIEVALKELKATGLSRKFAREMDLTYTSLGGSSAGCVDFFGISIISEPPAPMQSFRASRDQAREFVLVSEYANAGNIRDFLRGEFPKCSFQESWILVVQMLLGIATGIHTLHAHGVIHRDLHLNNILVTEKIFPDQPQSLSSEFSAKIADIGEGQHIAATSIFNASVEARDFHAPEISYSQTWSPASDVFAFAVAACKILDMRQTLCLEQPPEHVLKQAGLDSADDASSVLPVKLRQIIADGLNKDPKERLIISKYVDTIEDLDRDFYSEKERGVLRVDWATLDWWTTHAGAYERPEDGQTWSAISDAT